MPLLPANLAIQLTEDALPWDRSTQMHVETFHERYTLHDSYWIGMHSNCAWGDSAIAVFIFDPVWNSSVSTPTSQVADWPLLFLRFNCLSSLCFAGFRDVGGVQRGISGAGSKNLSEEEVVTVIDDYYGASISLQHFPLIDVLIMSAKGDLIAIPDASE